MVSRLWTLQISILFVWPNKIFFVNAILRIVPITGTLIVSCLGIPAETGYQHPPSNYDENSCPLRCGEDYYPLCAISEADGPKVFVNDCYLADENCDQPPEKSKTICFRTEFVKSSIFSISLSNLSRPVMGSILQLYFQFQFHSILRNRRCGLSGLWNMV